MSETKYVLVLANSAREGRHCVAGKIATPVGKNDFKISKDWLRLTDPHEGNEGAVPFANTVCPGHALLRPLDLIKVVLRGNCNNPDHPEDWYYDPEHRWQYVTTVNCSCLADIADAPPQLWDDRRNPKLVAAGYVRTMPKPATLYLLKAPAGWTYTYWKEPNGYGPAPRSFRRLEFRYGNAKHDFSVTDTLFSHRYDVFDKMQMHTRQQIQIRNPGGAFFCLSLTKLSLKFNREHYKICATIFET